jgi:hypothetical protein
MIYKNLVRTTQETCYVSATETSRLMLFSARVALYCKNHMEQTDKFCGQNAEFYCVKALKG